MKNLAIIPARGGSKRIPNKNIVDFFGKPLIAYSLDVASKSMIFDHIHVSTDSPLIASIVDSLGYHIDFLRPSILSDDHTGLIPVLQWVLAQYKLRGLVYDSVTCIYPTAPLLLPSDLQSSFSKFYSYKGEFPLLTFSEFPVPIEWAFLDSGNEFFAPIDSKMLYVRSQDLPFSYYEAASFAIYSAKDLIGGNVSYNKTLAHVLPRHRAVDIDNYEDLEYAKKLFLLNSM